MTSMAWQRHLATSLPFSPPLGHSDSSPCQWDGLPPSPYSTMMSLTFSSPRYPTQQYPTLTMFLSAAPPPDTFYPTEQKSASPKTQASDGLSGNNSKASTA